MKVEIIVLFLFAVVATSFATGRADSIPPFQYDAGVRAREAGDPLNGQCDVNIPAWPAHPITDSKLYFSTDGQLSWMNVVATNVTGNRYSATTTGIAGDAHWRFFFQTDSCWAGQTPFYSGSTSPRLPANWYVYWTDSPGLDSMNSIPGGTGEWLDIRGAGFCISGDRFYGKMVMASADFRRHDGTYSAVVGLWSHNYGYMFSVNNPIEPSGEVVYSMVWCDELDVPLSSTVEFAPGVLKVFDREPQEIIVIDDDIDFEFVGETMFVSCPMASIIGDVDYGTFPNAARYWNIQATTMHLFWTGNWWNPNVVSYFTDETIAGHAYYNHNGTNLEGWLSSPSIPNTPPILSTPSVVYASVPDQTTITVTYSDADENPPEYVRVEIAASRAVYDLSKAQVVGPHGWTTGIQYSAVISGYHGWGADFTFTASDGVDIYTLPGGPLTVESTLPDAASVKIWPNPFNSACAIYLPENSKAEIFDMNGRLVHEVTSIAPMTYRWEPASDLATGVYLVRVANGAEIATKRAIYMK